MIESEPAEKQWQSILALVLSALGIALSVIEAFSVIVLGLFSGVLDFEGRLATMPMGFLAWSFILSALLLMPVLILSIRQLQGKEIPEWLDTCRPAVGKAAMWVILAWPILAFLGWWISGLPQVGGYVLGLISILVTGLPVLWIYTISQRRLSTGSQTRKWRLFGFSFMVMPSVIIFVEMIALAGIAAIIGVVYLYRSSIDPAIANELNFMLTKLSMTSDMESMILLLKPYLLRPSIIFLFLSIFSGVIPLVEETLKPVALWALAGKELTPREGFVNGLICGAAFALMENLLYFSSAMTPDDWLTGAVIRSTTGILHMLGSGLIGWGLAKMWREGKWGFLARNLVAAIVFHGLWNALAIFAGVGPILVFGVDTTLWQNLLFYLPLIFVLLLAFIVLMLINRHFRKTQIRSTETDYLLEGNPDIYE